MAAELGRYDHQWQNYRLGRYRAGAPDRLRADKIDAPIRLQAAPKSPRNLELHLFQLRAQQSAKQLGRIEGPELEMRVSK